jgi:hypothetical protein
MKEALGLLKAEFIVIKFLQEDGNADRVISAAYDLICGAQNPTKAEQMLREVIKYPKSHSIAEIKASVEKLTSTEKFRNTPLEDQHTFRNLCEEILTPA